MDRKRCVLSKVLGIFGSNTSIESAILSPSPRKPTRCCTCPYERDDDWVSLEWPIFWSLRLSDPENVNFFHKEKRKDLLPMKLLVTFCKPPFVNMPIIEMVFIDWEYPIPPKVAYFSPVSVSSICGYGQWLLFQQLLVMLSGVNSLIKHLGAIKCKNLYLRHTLCGL